MKINKFIIFLSFVILTCSIFCFSVSADNYEYTAPEYIPEYIGSTIIGDGFLSNSIEDFYMYNSDTSNFDVWSYISNDYRENDILFLGFRAENYSATVPFDYYIYFPSSSIEQLVFNMFGGEIPVNTFLNNQDSFNRFYNYFYSTFVGGSVSSPPVVHYTFDYSFDGDINSLYYVWDFINYDFNQADFDTFLMHYYHKYAAQFDYITTLVLSSQDSYNEGYNEGYLQGKTDGYDIGNNEGYSQGFSDSLREQEAFKDGIATIFNAPFYLVRQIFSFELFGINIASIIFGILTVVLLAFVIKLFL